MKIGEIQTVYNFCCTIY